jgi:O-antigen biosynthesis protein
MKRQIIFVLGMHRSGTSAVTRGLKALGVDLGDNLMPPVPNNNETGFWEDLDLNSLNEEILALMGSSWSSPRLIEPDALTGQQLSSLRLSAIDLLNRKVGKSDRFGIKNPRMCRTLPFWQQVMGHCDFDDQYIITVRNPLSVARSLAARDGFIAEKSYLLWLGHMIPAMMLTTGKPRVVIDYDLLMNDPAKQMERVAHALSIALDGTVREEIKSFAKDFLSQELRHTQFDVRHLALDYRLPRLAADAYGHLLKLAQDVVSLDDPGCIDTWNRISETYSSLAPVYSLLDREESKLAEREVQITALELVIKDRNTHVGNLELAIKDRETHVGNLELVINDMDTHIGNLELAIKDKDNHIENLQAINNDKDLVVMEQAGKIQVMDEQIRNIEFELNMIKRSRAWRAAEFFRSLVYLKILGHFPLLQRAALTISRSGFPVFWQIVKERVKRYLWRLNDKQEPSEVSPSEIVPLKSMVMKTYVRLSDFEMKADKKVIRNKLLDIINGIKEKRGL